MNEEKIITEDELNECAMQIILKAGNARNTMQEALNRAKLFDFEEAERLVEEAKEEIRQSHIIHTNVISKEAAGEVKIVPSLLFNHAQDTLMTINTEINLSNEIIDLLKIIKEKCNG